MTDVHDERFHVQRPARRTALQGWCICASIVPLHPDVSLVAKNLELSRLQALRIRDICTVSVGDELCEPGITQLSASDNTV